MRWKLTDSEIAEIRSMLQKFAVRGSDRAKHLLAKLDYAIKCSKRKAQPLQWEKA